MLIQMTFDVVEDSSNCLVCAHAMIKTNGEFMAVGFIVIANVFRRYLISLASTGGRHAVHKLASIHFSRSPHGPPILRGFSTSNTAISRIGIVVGLCTIKESSIQKGYGKDRVAENHGQNSVCTWLAGLNSAIRTPDVVFWVGIGHLRCICWT